MNIYEYTAAVQVEKDRKRQQQHGSVARKARRDTEGTSYPSRERGVVCALGGEDGKKRARNTTTGGRFAAVLSPRRQRKAARGTRHAHLTGREGTGSKQFGSTAVVVFVVLLYSYEVKETCSNVFVSLFF